MSRASIGPVYSGYFADPFVLCSGDRVHAGLQLHQASAEAIMPNGLRKQRFDGG